MAYKIAGVYELPHTYRDAPANRLVATNARAVRDIAQLSSFIERSID